MKGFYNSANETHRPAHRIFVEIAVGYDPELIEKINQEIFFAMGRCNLAHSGGQEPHDAFITNREKTQ